MQQTMLVKKFSHMISSAQNFKLKKHYFNILGQSQKIQPVPVDFDIMGYFVSIYCTDVYTLVSPTAWKTL